MRIIAIIIFLAAKTIRKSINHFYTFIGAEVVKYGDGLLIRQKKALKDGFR